MTNYWWVNHKKTFKQETQEGYLWSPKIESDGRRSEFYSNMRKARPADIVISYADAEIKCIGTVTDYAFNAPKPESFRNSGNYWANEGWLVPVQWRFLVNPIKPKAYLKEILPLLPTKYSPLSTITGNGNQKAYFSKIDETLFRFFHEQIGFDFKCEGQPFSFDEKTQEIEVSIENSIQSDPSLSLTEKERLIKSRIGQGKFRQDLLDTYSECIVSGIRTPRLLIASHIKPWRVCPTNIERLDKYNGLLLAPHIDRLFDKGFISFEDSGVMLISSLLNNSEIETFGLKKERAKAISFLNEQKIYLAYHRKHVFLDEV